MTELIYETHHKPEVDWWCWSVKDNKGQGIHIWCQYMKTESDMFNSICYGGVESHTPIKTYEFQEDEPPIKKCWLTGCACWPDGTSLYWEENLKHWFLSYRDEKDNLDNIMESELLYWFESKFGNYEDIEPEFI